MVSPYTSNIVKDTYHCKISAIVIHSLRSVQFAGRLEDVSSPNGKVSGGDRLERFLRM